MKTIDGLMRFIARRFTMDQYIALMELAGEHDMSVRDYVYHRVFLMVRHQQLALRWTR